MKQIAPLQELKEFWSSYKEDFGYKPELTEISIEEIFIPTANYDKNPKLYCYGAFYLIEDLLHKKSYIGKTRCLTLRLKNHIYYSRRNKGIDIDKAMHNRLNQFKFYKILYYSDIGINFFTRKLETIIEQDFIKHFATKYPNGYNRFSCYDNV